MTPALWSWVAVGVAFAALELLLPYFGLIFAASSAFFAGLVSAAGISLEVQVAVFGIALLVQLFVLRPRIVRKLQSRIHRLPSRGETLLGSRGRVTRTEDAHHARATFMGQDWAVSSPDNLALNDEVKVTGADGVVLEVRKA